MSKLSVFSVLILTGALAGCGSRHPPTYPVTGKVVFGNGTTLTSGGIIISEPVSGGELPVNARSKIADDGSFRLSTYESGDGAVAGEHRFLVRAERTTDEDMMTGRVPRPVIDRRFESFATSGLQFTVQEQDNDFTIEVQRPLKPKTENTGDL